MNRMSCKMIVGVSPYLESLLEVCGLPNLAHAKMRLSRHYFTADIAWGVFEVRIFTGMSIGVGVSHSGNGRGRSLVFTGLTRPRG